MFINNSKCHGLTFFDYYSCDPPVVVWKTLAIVAMFLQVLFKEHFFSWKCNAINFDTADLPYSTNFRRHAFELSGMSSCTNITVSFNFVQKAIDPVPF